MKNKQLLFTTTLALITNFTLYGQAVSDFEHLTLSPNSYWDGSSEPLGATFTSGDALFLNHYDGYWSKGFAYSNMQDSTTSGFGNMFATKAFTGHGASSNYAIGKGGAIIKLIGSFSENIATGVYVTNSTYAYNSMRDGDQFSKKFGGSTGDDEDYFKLTIKKWLGGVLTNDSIEFYLADFRFPDNSQDYILKTWEWIDLSSLGRSDSLLFTLSSSDVGSWGMNTPGYFCLDNFTTIFSPPAGQIGSTAISQDSSAFIAWATGCTVTRGLQDISNVSSGYATTGDNTMALNKAGNNGVVSLGDGGEAILTFDNPITNGTGYDFAVFENSFSDDYLELAFVEVSSDGVRFVRFPALSYVQDTLQVGSFGSTDARQIQNLAGKYRATFGTPFDLQELADSIGLDINNITHVKIIDVVGTIQNTHARYDSKGNKINDPWPTAFASSGFDLDAVGVIHQRESPTSAYIGGQQTAENNFFSNIFPNPLKSNGSVNFHLQQKTHVKVAVADMYGNTLVVADADMEHGLNTIELNNFNFSSGAYFIQLIAQDRVYSQKIIVKND